MSSRSKSLQIVGLACAAVAAAGIAHWHASKSRRAPTDTLSTVEELDIETRQTTGQIWFGDGKQ